jgi:hypothetical protein
MSWSEFSKKLGSAHLQSYPDPNPNSLAAPLSLSRSTAYFVFLVCLPAATLLFGVTTTVSFVEKVVIRKWFSNCFMVLSVCLTVYG